MRLTRSSEALRRISTSILLSAIFGSLLLATIPAQAGLILVEEPDRPGYWGRRPAEGSVSQTDPPSFTWPHTQYTWELQCARDIDFKDVIYSAAGIELNVHCPPKTFGPGRYFWRYRGTRVNSRPSIWTKPYEFTIGDDAVQMPLPKRDELSSRIPRSHPRLFLRPENLPTLRRTAQGQLKKEFDALVKQCEGILADPPPTAEPPKYPPDMERKSEDWRKMWWGNRTYTIRALNSAATLAFTRLIGGREAYGHEAKRILLACAKWDPKGSTGYRYNDEAGMPYNYYFARTYTFVNDLLNDREKEICRKVMKVRGEEMYHHLCPRHLQRPYSSHSNRAWHFLGEVGIAFLGEIEGADDWVWFAMNVFFNAYPVWSDADGGWHEGVSYWSSYIGRFTWWADVMREAMGIDAYDKPYFSEIGYYAMYLMPPGKVGGGFGDLTARRTARHNRSLMTVLAAQAQNPHWQWYVDALGGSDSTGGYIGFLRGQLPKVEAKPPADLPTSRLFAGTGQVYLNSNLTDASESVQVVFKSSPFGTQSHGYESNNSFLLWAYGKRLLIRSGYRDIYGSAHHQNWMWSTRSTNCITVNGQGQRKHSAGARGYITAFETTPEIDVVIGDAGDCYEAGVEQFKRAIVWVKPDVAIVYDQLRASKPSCYEYWLHALDEIEIRNQREIVVRNDDIVCDIAFLRPSGLVFEQTNEYDPNPRQRISLREWHLTASTTEKAKSMEFVTVYWPHRAKDKIKRRAVLENIRGGYALRIDLADGKLTALLPNNDSKTMEISGLQSKGNISLELQRSGRDRQILTVREHRLP